jgi:hypothetical protein
MDAFQKKLRATLQRWQDLCELAEPMEQNMYYCAQNGIYHPMWARLKEVDAEIAKLGMECMTAEQRASVPVYLPFWQIEMLEVPTQTETYHPPPAMFPNGNPYLLVRA